MTRQPQVPSLSFHCFIFVLWSLATAVRGQGTNLGVGIVTRVNVDKYADLALDVRDVRQAQSADAALDLYLEGRNAEIQPGIKLTLASLSNELGALANNPAKRSQVTPNYLYHIYGLGGRGTDGFPFQQQKYADSYFRQVLNTGNLEMMADTLLVLHSWMYATHMLYHGVDICHKLTNADNPASVGALEGGGMDEMIAIWVGQDQTAGTMQGHGLYALTQGAGSLFGQLEESPEAPANTKIAALYEEGAAALSFPKACSRDNTATVEQLWSVTQRITTQMMIPLVQLLLDALLRKDPDATQLYAQAVVPQISQCKPSLFKRLEEKLLRGQGSFLSSSVDDIIADLQDSYDCLGFKCSDVGAYKTNQFPQCDDIPFNYPIVEYRPVTDVHDLAKIDLDLLQIRILTSYETYNFAKYLYSYGRNSPRVRQSENDPYSLRSLSSLATAPGRQSASYFADFEEYFNNPTYAHEVIIQTLDGTGSWGSRSTLQRAEMVVTTIAFQVLYMWAMAEMADAVNDCKSKDNRSNLGGVHSWDEVVAFLIGSLEGTQPGGSADSEDGQLLWGLANKRRFQFQTINSQGLSTINAELQDYLYAGRGELNALDCKNLESTVFDIEHLVLAPIIQSTLRYAAENEAILDTSESADLAKGEAFAFAIIPIVARYDKNAAQVIRENMEIKSGVKPVRDGPQAVADAFYEGFDELEYQCAAVGATPQVDACAKAGGINSVKPKSTGLFPASSSAAVRLQASQFAALVSLVVGFSGVILVLVSN